MPRDVPTPRVSRLTVGQTAPRRKASEKRAHGVEIVGQHDDEDHHEAQGDILEGVQQTDGDDTCEKEVQRVYANDDPDGYVRASNIGNTEPSENSQGKGGDLRSKYYPTLTVVRKT